MKKSILLLIFIFTISAFSGLSAYNETVENISEGLDLIRITNDMGDGKICNISVVRVDFSNSDLTLKPLFSEDGTHYLENVPSLVQQHNALAGINAEFFAWGSASGTGSPIGYNVVDGELISTPCITENVASVAMTANGSFIFDYFQSQMTLQNITTGDSSPIKHINKYDDLSGICVYTPVWGDYSLGASGNLIEVVVQDNTVTEIRRDMPAVRIPKNGYVIAGLADLTNFLTDRLHVGDKVNLDIQLTPDTNPENVIGGGTLLVKNGFAAPITHNISGRHPRSAFGVDQSGRYAYLITVDGRGAGGSIGMTLGELTSFMLDLGVYNGINFDGGGSTQLAVNYGGTAEIVNNPSQTPYRKVINALGVVSKSAEAAASRQYTSDNFETNNAVTYVYPQDTQAVYSISSAQAASGTHSGMLEYNFETENENVLSAGFSLNRPMKFEGKNGKISLDVYGNRSGQWLRAMVLDASGEIHRVTLADKIDWEGWKSITVKLPDEISTPAKLTKIYIVQPDISVKSKGVLYFDNLEISYSAQQTEENNNGETNGNENPGTSETPPNNGESDINTPSMPEHFVFTSGIYNDNTLLSRLYASKLNSVLENYDAVFRCDSGFSENAELSYASPEITEYENASFLIMKDIGFTNLYENMQSIGSAKSNNIIAIANKNPLEYSGYKEAFAKTGKNIIILFPSSEFIETVSENITYIGIPKTAVTLNPFISSVKIAEISINDFKVSVNDCILW